MNVFIYRTYHVSWRFTVLLSRIERQLAKAPLAAAISPYLISLTHPPMHMHEMKNETKCLDDSIPAKETYSCLFVK